MLLLDRPRHAHLIAECRAAGARIRLISDGDVGGAIEVHVLSASITHNGVYCLMLAYSIQEF